MGKLLEYGWPGNVRELQHTLARIVVLGRASEATAADLPPTITTRPNRRPSIDFGDEIVPIRELQRRYAAWALERLGGRKMLACERLGIDGKTLNKWLADDDRDG